MTADSTEEYLDPQIKGRIQELGRLAALPQITLELMRLLQDDRTTPERLQKLVEQDPALSAKVISLGNSSYYGLLTPVSTIARAIIVIGFRELQFLALGLGLADTFDLSRAPEGFNGEALWLHSLSVAWGAGEAAQASGLGVPGEAMLAGLLHNIGQIMLVTIFPAQFQRVMKAVAEGQPFLEAEDGLGLSHQVLGCLLARSWGMPPYLQDVIRYHHRPDLSPAGSQVPVGLVNLAMELADLIKFRLDYERPPSSGAAYWDLLPQWSRRGKEKLLEKAFHTLPLLAPVWRRMAPASSAWRKPEQASGGPA